MTHIVVPDIACVKCFLSLLFKIYPLISNKIKNPYHFCFVIGILTKINSVQPLFSVLSEAKNLRPIHRSFFLLLFLLPTPTVKYLPVEVLLYLCKFHYIFYITHIDTSIKINDYLFL